MSDYMTWRCDMADGTNYAACSLQEAAIHGLLSRSPSIGRPCRVTILLGIIHAVHGLPIESAGFVSTP